MKDEHVPQHDISTYANNKKAMYAVDRNGDYTRIASSGWNVEETVTKQALEELIRLTDHAHKEVLAGRKSPLFFHMYDRRMDLHTLAQSTGLYKWRIKRHFIPTVFTGLSRKLLQRYAEALGISVNRLTALPRHEGQQ